MSFAITKTGPHRNKSGGQVHVQCIDGKYSFGTSTMLPRVWKTCDGTTIYGPQADNITGPWHEPPTPPDGFQLMPADYVSKAGDIARTGHCSDWFPLTAWLGRYSDQLSAHVGSGIYIASPIPKPFRISDHGCGVYERRDGQEATVRRQCCGGLEKSDLRWSSRTGAGFEWYDTGHVLECGIERDNDLVRYIGPLPEPQPERPPLGIKPRRINDEQRREELLAAIRRFRDGKRKVPRDWYEELCDLLEREVRP
jgi:hypothetical protein